MITIRDYTAADRSACLAVFDGNAPQFFARSERGEFRSFLDAPPGRYFVAEHNQTVIGCGGFAKGLDQAVAVLCWGMVRSDRHRQGIGRLLLCHRLSELRADPSVYRVTLNTSQHARAFFEKFGFATEGVLPDGYAPGLDRCEMNLILRPIGRREL